jgi:hypothetical protein
MYKSVWGTRWRNWLRHCATSREVAFSISDGVIGIFHWHNHSGRTVALCLTQPLTEMSTRNISWRVKAGGASSWQPYHLHVPLSWNLGASTFWNPHGLSRSVMGMLYLLPKGLDISSQLHDVTSQNTIALLLLSETHISHPVLLIDVGRLNLLVFQLTCILQYFKHVL